MYEYRISFHPEVKIKRVRRRLLEILEDAPAYQPYKNIVAHDWSEKLVAAKKLPSLNDGPLEVTVKLVDNDRPSNEDAKAFTITIAFVNEITADNLDRSVVTFTGHPCLNHVVSSYLNGSLRSYNIAPLLSALNIILAKYPSGIGNGVKVGRDRFFFRSGDGPLNLGAGLEAWKVGPPRANDLSTLTHIYIIRDFIALCARP